MKSTGKRPCASSIMAFAQPQPSRAIDQPRDVGHYIDGPTPSLGSIDFPQSSASLVDSYPASAGYDKELDRQVRAWAGRLYPLAEHQNPDWMLQLDTMGPVDCFDRDELNRAILTAPNDYIRAYLCGCRAMLISQGIHTGLPYGAFPE